MIVEPDFLDHWKTRLLVQRTGDESAPLMLIRLWAHCQTRKKWSFNGMTGEVLSAICRSKLDGNRLLNVLNECGFVETNGQLVMVHDWEVSNRVLVSAWKNGLKGGRPKKTDRIPTGSIPVNRRETGREPVHLSNLSNLSNLKEGVRGRFEEWMKVRRGMGKKPSDWNKMFSEQAAWLAKFTESDQLEILSQSIRNGWQGLFEPKQEKKKEAKFERPSRQSEAERWYEKTYRTAD